MILLSKVVHYTEPKDAVGKSPYQGIGETRVGLFFPISNSFDS
jgi:hypothetical protein